jgi:cysteinyl-tRNA synthetase
MAWAAFGTSVDVIVGGEDLTYPHHAYQCAMVEAAGGVRPFARRQMHVGAVHRDGRKMAKSIGNVVTVQDLVAHHRPAALRLMLLDRRWWEPWEYDEGQLDQAEQRLDKLYEAAGAPQADPVSDRAVVDALLDDLDVPTALDVATASGGSAARLLLATLKLR